MEIPRDRLYAWCSSSEQAGDDPLQPQQSLTVVLDALGLPASADESNDDSLRDFAAALMALVRRETQPFVGAVPAGAPPAKMLSADGISRLGAPTPTPQTPPRSPPVVAPVPYEDAFPALGMGVAVPKAQPKAKKRVRATLLSMPSGSSGGGNIASLPSGEALDASRPAASNTTLSNPASKPLAPPAPASLVKPIELPPSHTQLSPSRARAIPAEHATPPRPSHAHASPSTPPTLPAPPGIPMRSPTLTSAYSRTGGLSSPTCANPRSPLSSPFSASALPVLDSDTAQDLDALECSSHASALRGLAFLHGRLVLDHLAPPAELAFLASLLRIGPTNISNRAATDASATATDTIAQSKSADEHAPAPALNFFACRTDCAAFAAMALAAALPLVRYLDSGVAAMLWADPVLRRMAPRCAQTLKHCAERRHSDLAGSRLRVGAGQSDVPFVDATDSRHHFKSPLAQKLFNNREQARDAFLKLLRAHGDARRRLDGEAKLQVLLAALPGEVDALLSNLMPGNGEWFGSLFARHLTHSALEAETDSDVVDAVARSNKADPAHLQRLHQRLSQRSSAAPLHTNAPAVQASLQQSSREVQLQQRSSSFGAPPRGHPPRSNGNLQRGPHKTTNSNGNSSSGAGAPAHLPLANVDEVAACFAQPSEAFFFDFLEMGGAARSADFVSHLEAALLDRISTQMNLWLWPAKQEQDDVDDATAQEATVADKKDSQVEAPSREREPVIGAAAVSSLSSPIFSSPDVHQRSKYGGTGVQSESDFPNLPHSPQKSSSSSARKLFGAGSSSDGPSAGSSPLPASNDGHRLDAEETVDALFTLRRLGKFLGLLAFRQHWPLSLAAMSGVPSDALNSAVSEATRVLALQTPKLNAREVLARAHSQGCLTLAVPWLTDYLRMLKWDLIARRTPYYAALLLDVKQIALHGPSPHSPGFNGNHALVRTEAADLCRDLHSTFANHLPPVQFDSHSLTTSATTAAAAAASPFSAANLALAPVLGTVDSSSQLSVRCFSRRLCGGVDLLLSSLLANKRPPLPNSAGGVSVLVAKKVVRPHMVGPPTPRSSASSSATSLSSSSAPSLERKDSATSNESSTAAASSTNQNGPFSSPDAEFGRRLRTAFFRRHPALQRSADFCVDAAVANAKAAVLATHCASAHQLGGATSAARSHVRAAAARDAALQIEEAVTSAMHALMPKHPLLLPEPVAATALHLTLDLALGAGLSAVNDAVAADLASQVQRHQARTQPLESPTSSASVAEAASSEAKEIAAADSTTAEPVSSQSADSTTTAHVEEGPLPPAATEVQTALDVLLAAAKDTSPTLPAATAGAATATVAAITALLEEMKESEGKMATKEARLEVVACSALLLEARSTAACNNHALLGQLPVLWRHCCPRTKRQGPSAAAIAALAPCLSEAVVLGGPHDDGESTDNIRFAFFEQLIDAKLLSLGSLEQCLVSILLRPVKEVPGPGEDQSTPSQSTHARARALAARLVAFVTGRQKSRTMALDSAVTPLHGHRLRALLLENCSS